MGESQGAITEPFSYKADANCAPARSAKKRMVGLSQWQVRARGTWGKQLRQVGHVYLHYVLSLLELAPGAQSNDERKPAVTAAMHKR